MLVPEDAELKLLSSLKTPQDVTKILQEGVTESAFIVYSEVFEHYRNYVRTYDELPDRDDIKSLFDIQLKEPGDLDYYLSEIINLDLVRQTHAAITERLGNHGTKLQQNPSETVRLLSEDLRKLRRSSLQHVAWLDKDALQRLGWLEEKAIAAEKGEVLGIPTGLRCFDGVMQGWAPGEAVMVMAPKGVGKSWVAMYFGVVAYYNDYKVLFISPEMSWEECALRFDVLLASQVERITKKKWGMTHTALTTGKQDQELYEKWLQSLTRRDQFIVVDSPEGGRFTLPNILTLIDEYRADLVVLDGLHLLGTDDARMMGWETIKQSADALKATAQHLKCSIVWTSQVDREAMRNPTEPASSGASAAYGKAAVEAANRLITLARVEGNALRRTFKVPNNRSGREYHYKQDLLFDVDSGHIEQMNNDIKVQEKEEVF